MSEQNDIPPDEPVYDGRNEPAPDVPLDAPREERTSQIDEPLVVTLAEDPRDNLVDKYRAKRDFEVEEDAALRAPEPPPSPQFEERPRFRVNVYGEEREVTQDELIRNYQINSAADVRLQDANARLAEAQRLLAAAQLPTYGNNGEAPPNRSTPEQYDEEPPTSQAGATDDQDLRQFVESMQLGSTEEAVEAARKLLSKTAVPQQPVDISGQVERVIASKTDDARSTAATERFLNYYPILDDPIAIGALQEASRVEMARDLAGLGLPLDRVLGLPLEQISSYHRAARLQGREGFRPPEAILGSVARNPRFHALAESVGGGPVRVNIDRSARKAQVQQQPALRNSPPPQFEREDAPESRNARVVAQMRKERGQAVFGT